MQRIKGKAQVRWWRITLLLLVLVGFPLPSVATHWGYPPDTDMGRCLAAAGITKVFPNYESAHAALMADVEASNPYYCQYYDIAPGTYDFCPSDSCGALIGCADCSQGCWQQTACVANWCVLQARGCVNAAPDCGGDLTPYWFVQPSPCDTSPAPLPTEQYDPRVEDPGKNKGGSGNPSSTGSTAGPDGTSCDDFVCNPVKVATGNKYEKAVDISIFTPGIPLEFVRYYNSLVASDGPLGYGWTHSFSTNLQVVRTTPTMRAKVQDADGRALYFSQLYYSNAGEINFYGESGVKDRLKQITSTGQWVLKRKSNLTYLFDANGVLTQVSDPKGNALSFTYSGGLLTQVSNNFGNSITIQYSGGRISSVTDPKVQSVSYSYTGSDLTGVSYPDGQSLSYAYSNHNMTDKYDSSTYQTGHWDYDANGRVSSYYRYVDNGANQEQVSFTYNLTATGQPIILTRSTGTTTYKTAIKNSIRVITEIDNCSTCGGITKKFTYSSGLDLASMSVVSGGQSYTTQYTYDSPASSWLQVGEVTSIKEAAGLTGERTTSYTYTHRSDDPFLLTQSTESRTSVVNTSQNKVVTTAYDSQGNVTSRSVAGYNGAGAAVTETTSYQYNTVGQITRIDGPRTDVSDITTFTYYPNNSGQGNNRGRLASITNALGRTTTFGNYDGNGNVGTITDPNGVVTARTYDQRNRILTVTNEATSAVTQYSYDTHGNLSSVTYPEGNTINFTYNLGERFIEIRDTLNNKIEYTYDDQGNRTSRSIFDPENTLKTYLDYTYDVYNRLSTIVNPDSTLTAYSYDGRGNITAITDPRNHMTTFTHDNLSRKSSMTQPFTNPIGYGYDTQDNSTLVTDPNNNSTHYAYDDFGKKYQTISPDTGTTTHTYDGAGNAIQTTDANGNTISYTYDALNRLTATQFADSSQNITNTYDSTSVTYGIGRLTGRRDPSGTYTFSYDAQGNMVREDKTIGGIVYTTQYTYNKNNKPTSITYPTGRTVSYTMDQAQRITQVDTTMGGSPKTLASSVAYLPFGGISSLIYGNNPRAHTPTIPSIN